MCYGVSLAREMIAFLNMLLSIEIGENSEEFNFMKSLVRIISVIVLFSAPPNYANAQKIYLFCNLSSESGGSKITVDVNLNEDSSLVGYYIRETGYSLQNIPATFTPREVMFSKKGTPYGLTVFRIDRVTMDYSEESILQGQSWWRRGSCKIDESAERKF
jgi:hypothetical protein